MGEVIKEIEEVENLKVEGKGSVTFEGYVIRTDKQDILVLISDDSQCCKRNGYFSIPDEDKFSDFIGTELLAVNIVDSCLNVEKLKEEHLFNEDAIFINVETAVGTLQFTVYNQHNGYYGHKVLVISEQLQEETYL